MFTSWHYGDDLTTLALFGEIVMAGLLVVLAGGRLTKYADEMADSLNLAAGWVGLLLLATVTSLPEVVSGGTAVAIGNPDLAFAAIFGSCSFNITIIVLLNAVIGGGSVLRRVSPGHVLTSSFGMLLIGLALMSIVLVEKFQSYPLYAQATECLFALIIFAVYLQCMRVTFRFEQNQLRENQAMAAAAGVAPPAEQKPLARAFWIKLGMASLVLVAAAWWLTQTGDVLSVHPIGFLGNKPLGATFVGACFLALSTSLPEIVTGVAAVRMGNLDLALGNLFGSNMFNIFVLPMLKGVSLIVTGGGLLMSGEHFQPTQNLIAGLLPVLLTAITVGALVLRTDRRAFRRFGVDSVLIAAVYVAGMLLLLAEIPGVK